MRQLFVALISVLAISQLLSAQEPIRERIEWADKEVQAATVAEIVLKCLEATSAQPK